MITPKGADRELNLPGDRKLYFHISDCADPCVLRYCTIRDGRWESTVQEFKYRMPALAGKDLTEADIRLAMETGLERLDRHYRRAACEAEALADAMSAARRSFSSGEAGWHTDAVIPPELRQERTLDGRAAVLYRDSAKLPWTLSWTDGAGTDRTETSLTKLDPVMVQGWADEKLAAWARDWPSEPDPDTEERKQA